MTEAVAAAACLQPEKTSLMADNNALGGIDEEETATAAPRNLTKAFEALCVEEHNDEGLTHIASPTQAKSKAPLISPTGVTDLNAEETSSQLPLLDLHPDLRRDLSTALVNRVSFYGIIHDINKEALAMASNDTLSSAVGGTHEDEEQSPLVRAATNLATQPSYEAATADSLSSALIDEEEWLLSTIAQRQSLEERACPDTFLQAMGEKEYTYNETTHNPVTSLAGSTRTQLWKPSRSWWEAKSGKNPWIEPALHNKRWRYLWPLIHYHKFLAKCIKKLKRNGVDVKQSVSPVSVFLREEVCAVSDHLAACSLFDSDQWTACLIHFDGWTDPDSEQAYRTAISKLKLRPLEEPGDVDSPLLRSQIDEHFLRSMATARAQLRETATATARTERKPNKSEGGGPPPVYPRDASVPKQIHSEQRRSSGRYSYPQQQNHHQQQVWYGQHPPMSYSDSSSVHSTLSGDSYPQHPMYPMHPPPYYHHGYQSGSDNSHMSGGGYPTPYDAAMYDPNVMPSPNHHPNGGWMDPTMMYAMQMEQAGYYGHPPQHHHPGLPLCVPPEIAETADMGPPTAGTETPDKDSLPSNAAAVAAAAAAAVDTSMSSTSSSQSPFWSHLDRATLAMGLATPAKASPPRPSRSTDKRDDENVHSGSGFTASAQPLLLQQNQYYGYGAASNGPYGAGEAYGPPSPATQFMMSPQASFAYNYGYGFSPARTRSTPRANKKALSSAEKTPTARGGGPKDTIASNNLTPPPPVRKLSPTVEPGRESPSTVETTAETESLHEPTTS